MNMKEVVGEEILKGVLLAAENISEEDLKDAYEEATKNIKERKRREKIKR